MLCGEIDPQNTQLTTIQAWHAAHFCLPQRQAVRHAGLGHGMARARASAETACLQYLQVTSSPSSGAPHAAQLAVGGAPGPGREPESFWWLMIPRMSQDPAGRNLASARVQ